MFFLCFSECKTYRSTTNYSSVIRYILKRHEKWLREERKKEKPCKNSYSELMNITSDNSTKTKIKIQQLKPNDIKAFAQNPSMTYQDKIYNKFPKPPFFLNNNNNSKEEELKKISKNNTQTNNYR